MLCICTFTLLKQSHFPQRAKFHHNYTPTLFLSLSLPPTFLPASWLTISPPSATSSANSGIILLVTSSCCICGGKGVVYMTETTCKCTAVVTKNCYHSDDQSPPLLTHTYCTCYAPCPKYASLSPLHTLPPPLVPPPSYTHTHQLFPSNLKQTLAITRKCQDGTLQQHLLVV